jgi:U3 small nucleolar RNA-associated protein 18
MKVIGNLTTSITDLEFNSTNEILVGFSKWKKNSIRMAHVPSFSVYSNWPNLKTNLNFVTAAGISNDSKYLVLGNDKANVYVYNFKHFN